MMYTHAELESLVKEWHCNTSSKWESAPLHEFLGWTLFEYQHWAETGEQPDRSTRPQHVAYYLSGC